MDLKRASAPERAIVLMLRFGRTDAEISFGSFETTMTETGLDNPDGGTGFMESRGMAVTKSMRSGGNFETRIPAIFLDEKLDGADGEGAVFAVLEQRSGGSSGETTRFIEQEKFFDASPGRGV